MSVLSRRTIVLGLTLATFSAPVFADTADHVANPDTIKITFGSVQNDPENSSARILNVSVQSSVAVAVVLRGVTSPAGNFRILKKSKLFGAVVWNDAKFVQINSGKTLNLDGQNYKLVVPDGFESGTTSTLEFDFGPKGEVYADFN